MSKKILFILLILLSSLIAIQGLRGNTPTYIRGWIGKYLQIQYFEVNPSDVRVNDTINLQFELQVYRNMSIEIVEVRITTRANTDTIYNKTLWENLDVKVPPNAIAIRIEESDELTATQEGILNFHMYAKYQYNEGNQTLEQEGTIDISNIGRVRELTYHDLSLDIYALTQEIENLNTTLDTTTKAFVTSYSELQYFTYFLAFTTCAFIATTFYYAKRKSKVNPS